MKSYFPAFQKRTCNNLQYTAWFSGTYSHWVYTLIPTNQSLDHPSYPQTNSWPLKMERCFISCGAEWPIYAGAMVFVSFREGPGEPRKKKLETPTLHGICGCLRNSDPYIDSLIHPFDNWAGWHPLKTTKEPGALFFMFNLGR